MSFNKELISYLHNIPFKNTLLSTSPFILETTIIVEAICILTIAIQNTIYQNTKQELIIGLIMSLMLLFIYILSFKYAFPYYTKIMYVTLILSGIHCIAVILNIVSLINKHNESPY